MKRYRTSIIILALSFIVTSLVAQTRQNSPYSVYGIGTPSDYSNPISFAMGGIGIAFQDEASLNPMNPASFVALREKSFIFDAGLSMNSSKLSSTSVSQKASYASLNHLLFGFQLMKNWKTSFGLIPFSDVGYNFASVESNDIVGDIDHTYKGEGGLSKIYWANAYQLFKNFSIGVETGYLFGKVEHTHYMLFSNTEFIFHNKEIEKNNYGDLYFKLGLQYTMDIKDNLSLTIGAIYNTEAKIGTDSMYLAQTVQTPFDDIAMVVNDVVEDNYSGTTTLPAGFGIGLMLTQKDKWKIGFDYETQFWSDFKGITDVTAYQNSSRFAVGAEFIPDKSNVFSLLKRLRYRAGFRYEKTPLNINGQSINEFGISFGFGLPLRRSLSSINFGVEIGRSGTASNELIKDSFVKFKLGVSMFQNWFSQRKYY